MVVLVYVPKVMVFEINLFNVDIAAFYLPHMLPELLVLLLIQNIASIRGNLCVKHFYSPST